MKIVQVRRGHLGVRQIAAALADVRLRRLGKIPPIVDRQNDPRSRAWTDDEFDTAQAMMLADKNPSEIGAFLGRTETAIKRAMA
jgi:hypothetical protein